MRVAEKKIGLERVKDQEKRREQCDTRLERVKLLLQILPQN
jgi:hypothetical protein